MTASDREDQRRAAFQQADAFIDFGRPEEAIKILSGVVNPGDAHGLALIARARLEMDDAQSALDAACAACGAQPQSEWAHRLRALALSRMNRHYEAVDAARVGISLAPHSDVSYGTMSAVLERSHSYVPAMEAAQYALQRAPDKAVSHLRISNLHLKLGNPTAAAEEAERALQLDPHNSAALNNLGLARFRRARVAAALSLFVASVRADPHNERALRNIGAALYTTSVLFFIAAVYLSTIYIWAGLGVLAVGIVSVAVLVRRLPKGAAGAGLKSFKRDHRERMQLPPPGARPR